MSPPNHYISRSKTVNETISLIADFRDFVQAGETASAWAVSIEVFTGLDNAPDNMFYQGLSINGVVLEQRFRLGIPGVIYSIKFTLTVNTGNVYELTSRLAVLPDISGATPVYNIAYETTTLYPYIYADSIISGPIHVLDGRLFGAINFFDSINSGIAIQSGTMVYQQYYYINFLDSIISNILLQDGVLTSSAELPYNDGPESIKSDIAIISGTLTAATPIDYTIPADSISSILTINNGTLS
jgi:hypothetical protein